VHTQGTRAEHRAHTGHTCRTPCTHRAHL